MRTAPPRPFIECDRVRRSDAASDLRVLVARHALFGVTPRDLTTAAKGRTATTLYRVCSGKTARHGTRSRPLPVSQVEGRSSSPPGCPPYGRPRRLGRPTPPPRGPHVGCPYFNCISSQGPQPSPDDAITRLRYLKHVPPHPSDRTFAPTLGTDSRRPAGKHPLGH